MKTFKLDALDQLKGIHAALDEALGDSDIEYMDDEELRDVHPTQWAAQKLAVLIQEIEAALTSEDREG